jgi:poly(3-hydroxybutyrate) depolymerase
MKTPRRVFSSLAAMALGIAACGGSDSRGPTSPTSPTDPTHPTNPTNPTNPTTPPATGLRTASTHPMQYYVSLPKNWSASRTWPVVVTIAGSGKEFPDNHAAFSAERDAQNYPFIIVTPLVLTDGGTTNPSQPAYHYSSSTWDLVNSEGACPFDFDGIKAVIADVSSLFKGQSTFFMTGFSGGNNTNSAVLLLHPEWLRGSAPAAGNFGGRCVTGFVDNPALDDPVPHPISTSPTRVSLPIRFFNGTADGNNMFLLPQRDSLTALARRNGYTNIAATMVTGAGHDPMPAQVLAAFYGFLATNER